MSNSFFISGFYVLDKCQTHDKDDCEEEQCANDGDDFGQDAHTSKFPFRFRARAADRSTLTLLRSAARKRVGKLRCETAFCSETSLWAISTWRGSVWLQCFLRRVRPPGGSSPLPYAGLIQSEVDSCSQTRL